MVTSKLTENNREVGEEFKRIANRVAFITILENVLLSIFKLFAVFAYIANARMQKIAASDMIKKAVKNAFKILFYASKVKR